MSNYVDINTFGEMDVALLSDLNASSASSQYPADTRKMALNRSYRTVGSLFRWPALEDAKKTSTAVGKEYYDAPSTWRPDSIWKVKVNGVTYGEDPDGSPLEYADYLLWREDSRNTNSTEKKWAKQWLRYFLYPVPTTVIANGIEIWGMKNVTPMNLSTDTTIFSFSMPECNEAIVLEASAILKNKGELPKEGMMLSDKALRILTIAFGKIRQESSTSEKILPFFNVPDFFSGNGISTHNSETNIGNFNR
jgi:hypothetical protein